MKNNGVLARVLHKQNRDNISQKEYICLFICWTNELNRPDA